MKKLFQNPQLIKTMHFLALLIIILYLGSSVYQRIELNYQLRSDLITNVIYERMIVGMESSLGEKVMIVLIFFFNNKLPIDKKEGEKQDV